MREDNYCEHVQVRRKPNKPLLDPNLNRKTDESQDYGMEFNEKWKKNLWNRER